MAFKGFKSMFDNNEKPEEKDYDYEEGTYEEEEEDYDDGEKALEVRVVRPKKFDEARDIASHLLNGRLVFLNLESTDKATGRRILDYLLGATFILEGDLKPVSTTAYIISPRGVDISGAIIGEATAAKPAPEKPSHSNDDGFGDL